MSIKTMDITQMMFRRIIVPRRRKPGIKEIQNGRDFAVDHERRNFGRLMWVRSKCGQLVVLVRDETPTEFKNIDEFIRYEAEEETNIMVLKEAVELGISMNVDVLKQIAPTESDIKYMLKCDKMLERSRRFTTIRNVILRYYRLESRYEALYVLMSGRLNSVRTDLDHLSNDLDYMFTLPLDRLTLLKKSKIVKIIRDLLEYDMNPSLEHYETVSDYNVHEKIENIKSKANNLVHKFAIAMEMTPEEFQEKYDTLVQHFMDKINYIPEDMHVFLTIDPDSPFFGELFGMHERLYLAFRKVPHFEELLWAHETIIEIIKKVSGTEESTDSKEVASVIIKKEESN